MPELKDALDRQSLAIEHQSTSLEGLTAAFRESKSWAKVVVVLGIIELLAVLVTLTNTFVGLHVQHDTHAALAAIKRATSTQAQTAAGQQTQAAVDKITLCTNSHTNREMAFYFHRPIPPLPQGCKPDTVP